ncbi:hypothetical protein LAJ55_15730, partial [Streptococcus pneumoniae]|uniref:hypothetical protein n=1 Tax=Streptococcus pneumoniae TaxID=1313 RepID=UPI001CBC8278
VIAERLERLAQGAISTAARLAEAGLHVEADKEIIDAEVVPDDAASTSNEPSEDDMDPQLINKPTTEDGQD